jgi:hypothetical protein
MNRRTFFKQVATAGGKACLLVTLPSGMVVMLTGCSAKGFAQTFINAAQAIYATGLLPANVAADLEIAINAMQLAVNGWNGTSMNCAFIAAANAAAAIIDGIEPGSTLAAIATVAVAAFDVVMDSITQCTTSPAFGFKVPVAHSTLRGSASYNTAKEKIGGAHFNSTKESTFKGAFNDAAKSSGLSVRI